MIALKGGNWLGQVPLVQRRSLGAGSQDLTDSSFSQVLSAPKAIVDFWSPGCPHCVAFKPVFEAAAALNPDILFAEVNVDNYQQNAAIYQVSGLPTVIFFANGKEVNRFAGGMESAGFQAEIAKAFSGGGTSPGGLPAPAAGGMIVPAQSSLLSNILAGAGVLGVLGAAGYFAYEMLKK